MYLAILKDESARESAKGMVRWKNWPIPFIIRTSIIWVGFTMLV